MALNDEGVVQKMLQLEKTVQTFRAEVNMKMSIMEQVLNNKNEQFQIQKDLLDREHSLYQTVLEHWKNIADMAASGLSLQFAQTVDGVEVEMKPSLRAGKDKKFVQAKRSSPSKARRERSKRLQAKRARTTNDDTDLSEGVDAENMDTSSPHERTAETPDFDDDDEEDYDSKGLEKKVYVNFYSTGTFKKGQKSSNPIWKYYLREENGMSAMCKPCEEDGVQHILQTRRGGTWNLYRHLKQHMPNINFPQQDESVSEDVNEEKDDDDRLTEIDKVSTPDHDEDNDVEKDDDADNDAGAGTDSTVPGRAPKSRKSHDGEEKLPGWMQCLEPFFDFVDFTGKKVTGTPEVVMRCRECAISKPNNKGIKGRGSHNFARHLKIHPQSNLKYITSLFEQKHKLQKEQQAIVEGMIPFPV